MVRFPAVREAIATSVRSSRPAALGLLRLGATLARRGPIAAVAFAASALTTLILAVVALVVARRPSTDAPIHLVPELASSALAWGGGFLLVFAAAASALRRDRVDGTRRLFALRAASLRAYLVARLGGLVLLLLGVVGGGTLVVGLVAICAARAGVGRTAQATLAAAVFAVAFALVMAPIAFAAVGARRGVSGYFTLLALVVGPALLVSSLGAALPREARELCAIPSALAALRSALSPGSVDVLRVVRASIALALFSGVALFFVRREVLLLDAERDA